MNIYSVQLSDVVPWQRKRVRGAKREGYKYEEAVAERFKRTYRIEHGLWLRYQDDSGWHNAQPDILVQVGDLWIVAECKRTWTASAWDQLKLYCELISKLWEKPTVGVQVCKNLVPWYEGKLVNSLEEAILAQKESPTWHLGYP